MAQLNKKSVDAVVKSVRKLNDEIIKLNKSHDELVADNVKAAETNKKLKTTVDNLKKSNDALNKTTKKLSAIEKEKISINKKHETAVAKTTLALSKSNRELIKATNESKRAERQAKLLVLATNAAKGSYDRISASLRANIDRFKKLSEAERENNAVGGKLLRTIQKQDIALKKLDKQLGRSQRNVGNYGATLGRARVALTSLLGAFGLTGGLIAFVGIIKGAIRTSIDFEKTFTNVLTLLDKVDKSKFGGLLRSGAADLIAEFGFAVEDVNKALFDAISAGVSAGDAIQFLRATSELAIGGVTGLSIAVDGVTSIMNAYGLAASEVNKVTSAFFTAQKFGKTTVAELSAEVGKVAPVAKAAGVSYQELLSTFAELTKQGISTQESSTAIKATITALIKPAEEAKVKFKELGIEVGLNAVRQQGLFNILTKISQAAEENADDLTVLIPNVRALTGVTALGTEALVDYNKILQQVNLDYGENSSLTEAFIEQLDTQSQKIKSLGGEFKAFAIELTSNNTLLGDLARAGQGVLNFLRQGIRGQRLYKEALNARNKEEKEATDDTIIFAQEIRKLTLAQAENQLSTLKGLEGVLAEHEGTKTQIRLLEEHIVKLNELTNAREASITATAQLSAASQKLIDGYVAEAEALEALGIKEEELAEQRAEAKLIASDEAGEEDFEAELEEDFEIELNATENFLNKKARLEAEDFLRKEELAMAEIELEDLKTRARQRGLQILASIFSRQSIIGKAAFIIEKANAIASILISGAKEKAGITAALAGGIPFTLPLIASLIAAANVRTAINVAVVAAQAIRGFKKGTDGKFNTPDTFRVGEGNKTELIVDKKGGITEVNKETLFTGMKGSMVISNPELKAMANKGTGSTVINNNFNDERIVKAIKGQPIFLFDNDKKVYGFKKGGYKRNWL